MDVSTFGGCSHPRHYECREANVTLCHHTDPINVALEAPEVPHVCTANSPNIRHTFIGLICDRNLPSLMNFNGADFKAPG
ncbi:hypothetical protein HPB50_011752 [Hyalomma asiaticum]|uniref:Uncharacterized protein n=1 Tax=Hyalomma asiaticum TaxID=266040 RepID=A0ACB7S1Z2_HYAAI|nr:hypothetical protein HPB50_011752 [Hyalomma asiaticum]